MQTSNSNRLNFAFRGLIFSINLPLDIIFSIRPSEYLGNVFIVHEPFPSCRHNSQIINNLPTFNVE
jgi:hypothetical protein